MSANPMVQLFESIGQISMLAWQTVRAMLKPPFEWRLTVAQLEQGGVDSWSITLLTAMFTGMVMATQFGLGLKPFGATMYTGKIVGIGIVRELGPVLTSLLVGGRVGAGFTAEIGSMAVTEQIDAIRALGADPVRKLVVPRVVAMTIAIPLLTIMANIIGCIGCILITVSMFGMTLKFSVQTMLETMAMSDVVHGLIKSLFFGSIIALVACWNGMRTHGGTEGVGRATTASVVFISVSILIADFILTQVLTAVHI